MWIGIYECNECYFYCFVFSRFYDYTFGFPKIRLERGGEYMPHGKGVEEVNPRFSYVRYDSDRASKSEQFKAKCEELETLAEKHLPKGRWKSLLFTNLEYAFMCAGKALRDEQIAVDGKILHEPARTTE
jgi:hypothetical protein